MKNGHSPNGTQRWYCKGCKKYFQRFFTNKGRLPEIKAKALEMTTNGSGIRDTSRVLGISPHTVIGEIKKTPSEINPYLLDKAETGLLEDLDVHISYSVEMDGY
jgi:transposase-like protein